MDGITKSKKEAIKGRHDKIMGTKAIKWTYLIRKRKKKTKILIKLTKQKEKLLRELKSNSAEYKISAKLGYF